jgi:L-threonylcarbamoyladenylate synthase
MRQSERITHQVVFATELLKKGKVVAIPTETVYGLAANALNEQAVKSIFELKNRPLFNPLIVHISTDYDLNRIARDIPEMALRLANKFWPGPLTLVLKKTDSIPDLITGGKSTVAVRMPDHPITQLLLKQTGFPLAAPSANPFGAISPSKSSHVDLMFGPDLELILEGGACTHGIESTIIGFEDGNPVVYRLGALSKEEIEKVTGPLKLNTHAAIPLAPGMLDKHYSPQTPAFLLKEPALWVEQLSEMRVAYLLFKDHLDSVPFEHQYLLSHQGNLKVAMRNLYAAMHDLDTKDYELILCEQLPDLDVGTAINDRLSRACGTEQHLLEIINRK